MELFIRSARLKDCSDITRLSDQLGYKVTHEKTRESISEILMSNSNCAFVITSKEKVIGWIHGHYSLRLQSAPFVEIGGLVIDENYRRKGIGKKLIQRIIEWAELKNITTIKVRCNSIRKEAHLFYKSIGFIEAKEQKIFSLQ